jgi:hypothetical protein
MSRLNNSQIEQYYFEQFRNDYPLPEGDIHFTDKPDVIVHSDSSLGIEITNLYIVPGFDPTCEQVQRRRRHQVLKQAQAAFLAGGGKRFELSVDFNPQKPIEKIKPLSDALCSLAQKLSSAKTGAVSRQQFEHIKALRFVYLNANEYSDATWQNIQCFSVPTLSVDRLREVVDEKAGKLLEYQRCDRYWLLVVIDLMDSAQDQNLYWPDGALLGKSPYEKILLYKPQYCQILEVPQLA